MIIYQYVYIFMFSFYCNLPQYINKNILLNIRLTNRLNNHIIISNFEAVKPDIVFF